MSDRLAAVVADVFGVLPDAVVDDTSPDTVDAWDSTAHINLVLALEAEFGISISPDDAADMLAVGLIREILREQNVDGV